MYGIDSLIVCIERKWEIIIEKKLIEVNRSLGLLLNRSVGNLTSSNPFVVLR